MKTIGNVLLCERTENGKTKHYIKVREYNRDGQYTEAEIFCRLTKNALEQYKGLNQSEIEIKDSFYSVDKYYKGEQEFTKATLVISEIV